MGGIRLSRPLGLGVVCPDREASSSDERVLWVAVDCARDEGSSAGLLVGGGACVLIAGAFDLDDQNAGMAGLGQDMIGVGYMDLSI